MSRSLTQKILMGSAAWCKQWMGMMKDAHSDAGIKKVFLVRIQKYSKGFEISF